MKTSWTTRIFVVTEVLCFFFYSIWWRKDISVPLGVAAGTVHLIGLILILRLWEDVRAQTLFSGVGMTTPKPRLNPMLALVVIVAFCAQLFFVSLTVLSRYDESVLLNAQIDQFSLFSAPDPAIVFAFIACCVGIIVLSVHLAGRPAAGRPLALANELSGKWRASLTLLSLLLIYALLESNTSYYWGLAERWPPLGTVVNLPFQWLINDQIVAIRFSSVLFFLGTAIVLYRLLAEEVDSTVALTGATLLLLCPVFFVYGHFAFREMGSVFFVTLGVYLLLRFLRSGEPDLYGLAVAFAGVGYLHRRLSIVLLLLTGLMLLLRHGRILFRWRNLITLALPPIALVWLILPWIAISRNVRAYVPDFENLLMPDHWLAYPTALPQLTGWVLPVMAVVGLITFRFTSYRLTLIPLLWMGLLVLLFAMDVTAPRVVDRFSIHFVPPIVILACSALAATRRLTGGVRVAVTTLVIVLTIPLLFVWRYDDSRQIELLPSNGIREIATPRYPYDALSTWLSSNEENLVVYEHVPWQSPLPVYRKTMGFRHIKLLEGSWDNLGSPQRLDDAVSACRQQGCDWLVLPANTDGDLFFYKDESVETMTDHPGIKGFELFENRYGKVALAAIRQ